MIDKIFLGICLIFSGVLPYHPEISLWWLIIAIPLQAIGVWMLFDKKHIIIILHRVRICSKICPKIYLEI